MSNRLPQQQFGPDDQSSDFQLTIKPGSHPRNFRALAEAFRIHVMPKLDNMKWSRGVIVACRTMSFYEALIEIESEGRRLGLLLLPEPLQADILDWISAALVESITESEARIERALAAAEWTWKDRDSWQVDVTRIEEEMRKMEAHS